MASCVVRTYTIHKKPIKSRFSTPILRYGFTGDGIRKRGPIAPDDDDDDACG